LVVELKASGPDCGLWGEVALEIRYTAFLTDVHAHLIEGEKRLHVRGRVEGESTGLLELHVLANGRAVGYLPCAAGELFAILTDELTNPVPPEVRVELICGAIVWYAADVMIVN